MHFITPWTLLKMTRIVTVRSLLVKGKHFQFNTESKDERGIFTVNNGIYKGKGLDFGVEPPRWNVAKYPPPPNPLLPGAAFLFVWRSCRTVIAPISVLLSHFLRESLKMNLFVRVWSLIWFVVMTVMTGITAAPKRTNSQFKSLSTMLLYCVHYWKKFTEFSFPVRN